MTDNNEQFITVDGVNYSLDQLTAPQRRMVLLYQEWQAEEQEITKKLAMVQGAQRDISRQIVLDVRAAVEAKANEEAATEVEATEGSEATEVAANDSEG